MQFTNIIVIRSMDQSKNEVEQGFSSFFGQFFGHILMIFQNFVTPSENQVSGSNQHRVPNPLH